MAGSFAGHGLTDLTPEGRNPVVDIVFVHGLHGDSEDTWKTKGKQGEVFWPQDLLPEDLKQARILTWGYDAHIAHFWTRSSVGNVDTHARNLCADISGWRERTNTTDRPIIFVAHSLGGIVCADALILAQNSAEAYANKVAKSVRGIVFLGTPHEGSDKTKWAKAGEWFVSLFKDTNKEIIDILEKNSVKLADIGGAFLQLVRRRREAKDPSSKLEIVCFFEEQEMAGIGVIVTQASATLDSYDIFSIEANHRDMCKFVSRDDPGYVRVLGFLQRWVDDLSKKANTPQGWMVNNAEFRGDNYGMQLGQNLGGSPASHVNFNGPRPSSG